MQRPRILLASLTGLLVVLGQAKAGDTDPVYPTTGSPHPATPPSTESGGTPATANDPTPIGSAAMTFPEADQVAPEAEPAATDKPSGRIIDSQGKVLEWTFKPVAGPLDVRAYLEEREEFRRARTEFLAREDAARLERIAEEARLAREAQQAALESAYYNAIIQQNYQTYPWVTGGGWGGGGYPGYRPPHRPPVVRPPARPQPLPKPPAWSTFPPPPSFQLPPMQLPYGNTTTGPNPGVTRAPRRQ